MKPLLLKFTEANSDETETYVLEGDRRQSNERMIQRGLEKLTGEQVEFLDEEKREYRSKTSGNVFHIEEARLLKDEEFKEQKREHFTLVINENVTEGSCQVRYS